MQMVVEWIKKNWMFLAGGFFVFCMVACFVSGCNYHKHRNPCPEPSIVTNTVLIHDTITHEIVDTFPYYIIHNDTIIQPVEIPAIVDTAKILADYYSLHVYNRTWQDSLVKVDLRDTVTQNRFLQNEFRYKILRPQTIINTTVDNSIHYNKYLYLGLDIPFKGSEYSEIEGLFAWQKGYIGVGYAPLKKGVSLSTGFKIAKFK